jgi:hypothetical protein
MINVIVDLIGFNDPTVHKIHKKYGIFSAKLWNVSNIAFRISLFCIIVGLMSYGTHLVYFEGIENEPFFILGVIFILTAQFIFWIGQFSIILYQILRRDILWAIGSFFIFFIIFIYKSIKKNEL